MNVFKNLLFIIVSALSIVAGVIGIGFVSGKEIVTFFFNYEPISVFVIVCTCLFFFIILLKKLKPIIQNSENDILKNCKNNKIIHKNGNNTIKFIKINNKNHKLKFQKIYNIILGILCLLSTATMIAGVRNLILKLVNDNVIFEYLIAIFIIVNISLIVAKGLGVLSKISSLVTFILIFTMIINVIIGFFNNNASNVIYSYKNVDFKLIFTAITSSIFYVSMNVLSSSGVVMKLKNKINNKVQAILISAISTIILFILMLLIVVLYKNNVWLVNFSMPLLELANMSNFWLYYIYFFMILCGAIVSIMTISYSGKTYLEYTLNINVKLISFAFLFIAFIVSFIGFDFLVDKIYPLIGMVYLILGLIKFFIKKYTCIK